MISLFPILIHQFDVFGFKKIQDKLIDFVYAERKKDSEGLNKSNVGGWHSINFCDENAIIVSTIKNEVGNYFSTNRIFKEGNELKIINTWININKKGDRNDRHMHPGSHLSGVFWIKIPDKSGNLIFDSPHGFTQYDEISNYSDPIKQRYNVFTSYWIPPVEGRIVLFPSILSHKDGKNESNKDRISVSFNLKL